MLDKVITIFKMKVNIWEKQNYLVCMHRKKEHAGIVVTEMKNLRNLFLGPLSNYILTRSRAIGAWEYVVTRQEFPYPAHVQQSYASVSMNFERIYF